MSRNERFAAALHALGYAFDGPLKIGGNYVPVVRHGDQAFVSGQVPRVGDEIIHPGRVGERVSLADAQTAAKVSALRCLALLADELGSLEAIKGIVRMTVFVQSAQDFTQQSEVSNGASQVLYDVLGEAGAHTRTSVGVYQLPKNAPVEVDMIAAVG
ncbi:RidA family protein [Pseudomonas entomophila]|uniref:RidA family protein n=1 Tax=Pseudomonas entomophila TaxID=312306 RepID=UPI0023D7D672|nr:RidA family protein [Pseudomonas entomophila]MDF0732754.1 RidA family protein [Pseudomonas entomophila]